MRRKLLHETYRERASEQVVNGGPATVEVGGGGVGVVNRGLGVSTLEGMRREMCFDGIWDY